MFPAEVEWIKRECVPRFPIGLCKIVNIGSSTRFFRTVEQPHVGALFSEIAIGRSITHVDLKAGDGIDIVGCITSPSVNSALLALEFDVVICSNVLEHVADRANFIGSLNRLMPVGSLLVVTVPLEYPYHNDPIDTMYRPSIEQLRSSFGNFDLICGEELTMSGCYFNDLIKSYKSIAMLLLRLALPFYRTDNWKKIALSLLRCMRSYKVTCGLFIKREESLTRFCSLPLK